MASHCAVRYRTIDARHQCMMTDVVPDDVDALLAELLYLTLRIELEKRVKLIPGTSQETVVGHLHL